MMQTKYPKIRLSKLGDKNPIWKGDNVGYKPLHAWIRRNMPKPKLCENCNLQKPFEVQNTTGIYDRNFNNWRWTCRRCHMLSDGRMNNLAQSLSPEERSEATKKAWVTRRKSYCFECGHFLEDHVRRGFTYWNCKVEGCGCVGE